MKQPVANLPTHTNCTKRTRELDDGGVAHFHDRRLKRSKHSGQWRNGAGRGPYLGIFGVWRPVVMPYLAINL